MFFEFILIKFFCQKEINSKVITIYLLSTITTKIRKSISWKIMKYSNFTKFYRHGKSKSSNSWLHLDLYNQKSLTKFKNKPLSMISVQLAVMLQHDWYKIHVSIALYRIQGDAFLRQKWRNVPVIVHTNRDSIRTG